MRRELGDTSDPDEDLPHDRGPDKSKGGVERRRTPVSEFDQEFRLGRAAGERTMAQTEVEPDLSKEERLHRLLMRRARSREAVPWRRVLVPGGLRLMAREMHFSDLLREARPRSVESGEVEPHKLEGKRPMSRGLEQLRLLVELIGLTIGRLIVLRAAGLRQREQRRLRHSVAQ